MLSTPSSTSHDKELKAAIRVFRWRKNCYCIAYAKDLHKWLNECFYVTHGGYALRSGVYAYIAEALSLRFFRKPFIGTVLRRVLGSSDWIIYGHAHKAFTSWKWRVIITGVEFAELMKLYKLAIITVKGKGKVEN